ncbi:Aromatic-L-amino-acid decarboxylase [Candidatus Rhodobacter oscarellae]|uniref:Aromatic-L-amino-acid decarboxylase n=1 Tax=Candidatus Rhodobacter oscarellae TaxID=1675527 RepID=A0A0J9GTR4_9RHOB|nr:aminotransferase class V-fold PLP-dependent enzyme [Candidatus Rhodobacter lobularis]KMW56913.1 Aromatic-L-amino-acid decarboxylase [Candidatus Rhodobacter lobularis]
MAAPAVRQDHIKVSKQLPLERAAAYGQTFRCQPRPLHPTATTQQLRDQFCKPLPEMPTPGEAVIDQLIAAAEPGLVGNTDPNFYAWVMGGSDPVGVAADWLTSIWGQNAAIFQTSPAAAIAEEAVSEWLLDLLDLPRSCSVGFVTGATMAGFVALAAARTTVLARQGHDFEQNGLQSAPLIQIYISDDSHASNLAALRHLGFGEANLVRIPSDADGLMSTEDLKMAMVQTVGPKIIIATAGHINSGGFENFELIADLAQEHNAWLHVDGAFGLWARVLPEMAHLTRGLERADSWSVDGHKWLQIPYDSGFAIVKDAQAHKRAMDISAGYLNQADEDGRNPTEFNPELSRRARGFAAWAIMRSLGKSGIRDLVAEHCESARGLAEQIDAIPGVYVIGSVTLNQIILAVSHEFADPCAMTKSLAGILNSDHGVFVRTAEWKGRTVLRFSLITKGTGASQTQFLSKAIRSSLKQVLENPVFAKN